MAGPRGWRGADAAVLPLLVPQVSRRGIPIALATCHDEPMSDVQSPTQAFRAARDLLLRHREDYAGGEGRIQLAAAGRVQLGARLVRRDRSRAPGPARAADRDRRDAAARITYAELAARSNQVANWLRGLGVRRGDRVLLMLGNIAPLWEVILAAMKLGAVIIPASTLLGPEDLADRIARGDVRHVITESGQTPTVRRARRGTGPGSRSARRWRPADGWHGYAEAAGAGRAVRARRGDPRPATRCCCTSRRAPPPSRSWSSTPTPPTRPATCPPCTGSGLQPGDVHLNISSPGWAKHAWSNVYAPWNAGATALVLDYERFSAQAAAGRDRRAAG